MFDFFHRSATDIVTVQTKQKFSGGWAKDAIVFYVKNGKGILSVRYGYLKDAALETLVYGDVPLIKFHGDGYFCPTCEKLVSAGYGLDMGNEQVIASLRERFNQKFVSLERSLENLHPLLALLPTGYYVLADTELYPTDGNGRFFWKVNNTPRYDKASCPVYGGDGVYSSAWPAYLLPTQPPSHYNQQRADFYRQEEGYRALAFAMEGSLCALLDGHHKAAAAALENRKVETLVIIPATYIWEEHNGNRGGLSFYDLVLDETELPMPVKALMNKGNRQPLSEEKTRKYLTMLNTAYDDFVWFKEFQEIDGVFPGALASAQIEWAGDLTDERLDKILNGEEQFDDTDALTIANALCYLKHERFKETAFYFCRNFNFVMVWYEIYQLLTTFRDEDVEDFFVAYLVEDDKSRPEITKLIDNYFADSPA